MTRRSRRDFLKTSVLAAGASTLLAGRAPAAIVRRQAPAVVCSPNGMPYVAEALERLAAGEDTLDVAVAAVNQVENDPKDDSVGFGGLPNEDGIVELDSCCMHGPTMNAGGVASLRNIKNPASVARDVLWYTDHVLLVGDGALRFARAMGYPEENLLTEESRRKWLAWKRSLSPKDDWLEPREKRPQLAPDDDGRLRLAPPAKDDDEKGEKRKTGTINFDCCNAKGEVSGVTTTSGLAWKIPGRVGDSPIIGAGLYVDGEVAAAGSTGRGEAVIVACGSHTVVEAIRSGLHPKDACLLAVKRVVATTKNAYLRYPDGRIRFQVNFYAVDVKGRVGAASVFPSRFGQGDAQGARLVDTASLYDHW
ncbi:MAG: N(4)-(beta-N-acetylglucosaminyl)-L-asparaginase [Planctomycetes bacterium]|nr:N(4)-(beta-N-acetylglucosaminyl)-L-asparaginase [Planctomycetota bacterium]